jgi:WXG100 family type VII secretion target
MSRLVVDLDRLADLIDRMELFQAHLTRTRDEVDARVRHMHGSWTGTAASAQAEAHARWATGAAEVQEALADLRSIAATAHANFEAARLANRQMWAAS